MQPPVLTVGGPGSLRMTKTVFAPSVANAPSAPRTHSLEELWTQALAGLGTEPLLSAPLLTMGPQLFPDRWTQDVEAARRMVVRALAYLGLEVREVLVVRVDQDSQERAPQLGHGQALPAWFAGWEQDLPRIAVQIDHLVKPALLVPALIRASIHAFLVKQGKVDAKAHDSALIDLMGLQLGWGIVLTHAAHVIEQSSGRAKYVQLTQLPPAAMATSLAWMAIARRLDSKSVREIAKSLAPNQRDALNRAYKATRDGELAQPEALRELPPPDAWPAVWDLESRVRAAKRSIKALPVLADASEEVAVDRGIVGKNKGKAVFMVRRRLSMRVMKFGVGAVFAASMLMRSDPSMDVDPAQLMLGGGALVLLGGLVGSFFHEQRCSDAKCDAKLSQEDKVCPRCGGTISGVIANAKERLAAEEALGELSD